MASLDKRTLLACPTCVDIIDIWKCSRKVSSVRTIHDMTRIGFQSPWNYGNLPRATGRGAPSRTYKRHVHCIMTMLSHFISSSWCSCCTCRIESSTGLAECFQRSLPELSWKVITGWMLNLDWSATLCHKDVPTAKANGQGLVPSTYNIQSLRMQQGSCGVFSSDKSTQHSCNSARWASRHFLHWVLRLAFEALLPTCQHIQVYLQAWLKAI